MSGYGVTNWVDGATPAISAANLNKLEQGLLHALGFDTAADLRATGRPTAVQSAWTRGGAAVGDGDGGLWRWASASTAGDDAVSVLLPDGHEGAGRWVRVIDRPSARAVQDPGEVKMFAGDVAPEGWLLCQGQAISRATYTALFAVIGTKFGAGNGATTFNVPDLRDRVPTGASASQALGSYWGATTPQMTVNSTTLDLTQIPSHAHGVTDPGHGHAVSDPGHVHGVYDPGHAHSFTALQNVHGTWSAAFGGYVLGPATYGTNASGTGISLYPAGANISIQNRATGLSIVAAGGGAGHTHTVTWGANATAQPAVSLHFIIKT